MCKDKARCQEHLQKNLIGSVYFSFVFSQCSQNYLPNTHLQIVVCNKNHRQNGLIFPRPRLFLLNCSWGGWGRIHRDIIHHLAWGSPSLVHHHLSVSPNSFRATGTEGWWYPLKKEVLCIDAHFSELFWPLRRTPGALGQCVNRLQRRPYIMSWQASEVQYPCSQGLSDYLGHTQKVSTNHLNEPGKYSKQGDAT